MKHKHMGNATRICHKCKGIGLTDSESENKAIPCECDAGKEIEVYEDDNAPYKTYWAVIDKDKKSDYCGEVEHASMISADECYDLEQAIAVGLAWLRSKEYKMMEAINKQGFILVTDRNGIHAYEASCKKLKAKVK